MTLTLRIDNEPTYLVDGAISTAQGERTLSGPMAPAEISGLLECPPHRADIRIRTVPQTPPLPAAIATLSVNISHPMFSLLRRELAAAIGVDLEMMDGYRPDAGRIAELRGLALPASEISGAAQFAQDQQQWWTDNRRRWQDVDSDLVPLLDHPDHEGDLPPADCRRLAPALRAVLGKLSDTVAGPARELLQLIEACAQHDRRLLF